MLRNVLSLAQKMKKTTSIDSIVPGLTDKWSNDDKRRFMEDWLNDSFMFEIDEFIEHSGIYLTN